MMFFNLGVIKNLKNWKSKYMKLKRVKTFNKNRKVK